MVVRMRHTRSHTRNRRSHHALRGVELMKCKNCGGPKKPHITCQACGFYRGRKVIDLVKKTEKKLARNASRSEAGGQKKEKAKKAEK